MTSVFLLYRFASGYGIIDEEFGTQNEEQQNTGNDIRREFVQTEVGSDL
jgi:hypothetical protein